LRFYVISSACLLIIQFVTKTVIYLSTKWRAKTQEIKLVRGYSKCRSFKLAREVFDKMRKRALITWLAMNTHPMTFDRCECDPRDSFLLPTVTTRYKRKPELSAHHCANVQHKEPIFSNPIPQIHISSTFYYFNLEDKY
jgi:pentatricopeptide repeat protein